MSDAHNNDSSSRDVEEENSADYANGYEEEEDEARLPPDTDNVNNSVVADSSNHFKQRLSGRKSATTSVRNLPLHSVASDHQLNRLPYRTWSTKRPPPNNNSMMKQSLANSAAHIPSAASLNTRSSLEYSSGFGSHTSSPTTLSKLANTGMQNDMQHSSQGVSEKSSRGGLIMRPVRQPSLGQAPPDQLYYTQIQQQQQQQQQQQGGTPRRTSLARQDSNAMGVALQQQAIGKQQYGSSTAGGRRQSRGSVLNEEVNNIMNLTSPMVQRRMMQPTQQQQHSSALHQVAIMNDNMKRILASNSPASARQGSIISVTGGDGKFAIRQPHMVQMVDGAAFGGVPRAQLSEDEEPDLSFQAFDKLTYADLLPYNQTSVEPTREFLREAVELILQYLESETNREQKVLNFKHPIKMLQTFDFTLPQDGFPLSQILRDMRETLANAVRTGHPRFFNQLSTGKEIVSLVGDWVTSTTNSNMFTYEIGPVYVIMEAEVLRHMREIIGWPDGEGDGIFAPGGTICNLYALNVARHKKFPQSKQKGMSILPRLVLFTSEQSHYSIKGAAAVTGIGTSNVVEIHTDERGKMIPSELDREVRAALDRGDMPFFVNATAGTTVLGAYDPIHDIADICDKYDLWLHVDGAWGAGCLMSPKLRHLADGIERADSVTWNPHKLMGALLQCSAILLREPGLLFSCNQMCADYLFQQDKHYDVKYDTGDRAIQCGRHVDIFKLWLMWRAFGDNGFAARVEHLWAMRDYLVRQLKSRQDFWILLEEPECTNVCFWYIPPSLAEVERTPKLLEKLGRIIPVIKARMMDRGTMMIGYQPASGKPNFFRAIISNAAIGIEDLDFMIDEIVELGKDM